MDLFRTKSVEHIEEDARGDGSDGGVGHLRRHLSARHLIGFGIGVVIGTGIFTLTGLEARNTAGPSVVFSFAIAGVVALLAALCYAELASSVPTAGSAYSYAYATTGELIAWIIGWDLFLEFALGAAVVARGWSGYVGNLLHLPTAFFGETSTFNLGAALIVVVLTVVAVLGVRESARVTGGLVVVKVAICLFVILAGAWFVKGSNLTPFVPPGHPASGGGGLARPLIQAIAGVSPAVFGVGGILTAAAVVFFAYTGFEAVANLSEETKRPGRDLPLGLLGTLGVATALYIGVALVVVGMVEYTKIDESAPIADAFDQVHLGWAAALVSIAAVAGLTSVILVDLVTVSRIGFAMGRDGLLPIGGQGEPPHRHPGPHDAALRGRRPGHGDVRAAEHAGRPGEHRHAVRLRAGLGRRAGTAPAASGAHAPVPRAVVAARADPVGPRLPVSDAQSQCRDLAALPRLAGDRAGHLLRLRPPPLPRGPTLGRGRTLRPGCRRARADLPWNRPV